MRTLPLLLFLIAALAGCTEDAPGTPVDAASADVESLPPLHGWIFDEAIRPMAGVTISVLETNATTTSNGDGFYGFDDLRVGEPVILVATFDGYKPGSKQVTLPPDSPVRLNFTMVPKPVKIPSVAVLPYNGILTCQTSVVVAESETLEDCSNGAAGDIWEFAVGPDLAGVVIEIGWEPGTLAAESLQAKLETLGLGDQNQVLAQSLGTSVLRLQVAEEVAKKFYSGGGLMRLSVWVSPNTDENEAGAGVGVAANQEFDVAASLFYVEPPEPSYSVVG